ncbi:dienelactone hydrolase family protein [Sediminicoccus sp. KRV36]|uniref:dienelactone hydrolase family protein n=1 Tax=Sediminicoccus sp. KRV36 TaxID=3133721 RepID=UPI002010A615|nr:dienelactone hydrolase family protein [Sediminicoccus rosea]UPY36563.1 dienelactone hydrolase family protein [Sediminicoccus rosea]
MARLSTFLLGLLLLGCAAAGVTADEAPREIPFPEQRVTVPGAEAVALRALLYLPPSPSRPAVIALHSCSGLGPAERPIRLPAHQRDWAIRLLEAGHPVLFPDSFGSRGLGEACGVRGFPAGPYAVRRLDALAAADWARAQPWGRGQAPILIGWSHGGSTTLAAWATAPSGALSAAIALYPGCGQGEAPVLGSAPLLMLLGAEDDWTPPEPCRQIAARAPGVITVESYAGAHHGFDGLAGGLRTRQLPNGRSVSLGPNGPAREAARLRVAEFLASQAGLAASAGRP